MTGSSWRGVGRASGLAAGFFLAGGGGAGAAGSSSSISTTFPSASAPPPRLGGALGRRLHADQLEVVFGRRRRSGRCRVEDFGFLSLVLVLVEQLLLERILKSSQRVDLGL